MRFQITFDTDVNSELSLPLDYRQYLTAAIYSLLSRANPDYATFLHDEGYATDDGTNRRFKLFTYSRLSAPASRRRIDKAHDRIVFAPGPITWLLSSPVEDFVRHVAGGMLAVGTVQLGPATLRIDTIAVLPTPVFRETTRFTCLSPIVAAQPLPKEEGRGTHFIRPEEDPAGFSEAIRKNLTAKHRVLQGRDPEDTRFEMTFDPDYLSRHRGGTKLTTFKGINVVGALAPFKVTGSVELMSVGWEAGMGSKNSLGHGLVEAMR